MQDKAKIPMLKIAVIIKKSGLEVSFPNPGQEPATFKILVILVKSGLGLNGEKKWFTLTGSFGNHSGRTRSISYQN